MTAASRQTHGAHGLNRSVFKVCRLAVIFTYRCSVCTHVFTFITVKKKELLQCILNRKDCHLLPLGTLRHEPTSPPHTKKVICIRSVTFFTSGPNKQAVTFLYYKTLSYYIFSTTGSLAPPRSLFMQTISALAPNDDSNKCVFGKGPGTQDLYRCGKAR